MANRKKVPNVSFGTFGVTGNPVQCWNGPAAVGDSDRHSFAIAFFSECEKAFGRFLVFIRRSKFVSLRRCVGWSESCTSQKTYLFVFEAIPARAVGFEVNDCFDEFIPDRLSDRRPLTVKR